MFWARIRRRSKKLITRLVRAWEAEVRARAHRKPLWPDTVLYESFAGNGALDNPEAVFRALIAAPDQDRIRHIWVLTRGHREFRAEFRRDRRVRFVRHRSSGYFRALARAQILINNATFPHEFDKRPGQTYVNTWHGTPLKHMGYDMPGGALQSGNVMRNLLSADVLLSQSPWMTEQMYLSAYKLRGAYAGKILELGYPRVDRQDMTESERRALLDRLGVAAGRSLVTYAPTWTGESFGAPRDEADDLLATVTGLQERLGSGYRVVLKAHQAVHHLLRDRADARDVLISNDLPTNALLGVTDHLITDFSSIFFDFLVEDRPITFFVPDPVQYREERGAYFADHELPGEVVRDLDALAARVRAEVDTRLEPRREWAERFTPHSDGHAAERLIDVVFRGRPLLGADASDVRRKVLIYLGGMRSNGITSAALNLLTALDHDRLDVSVLMARPASAQQRANQALIDPRVRQFIRQGGMTASKGALARLKLRERLLPDSGESPNQSRLYRDEWHRLMGDTRFDAIADFSGYSRFWSQILLHSPDARRSIWLHNEMAAEVHRPINGRARMRRALPAVFALYPRFDALVSVSPELAKLNRAALASWGDFAASSFVSARNLIDADRIRRGAAAEVASLPELADAPLPTWAAELGRPGLVWFVNVGRLSPEKNQLRLLEAFARTHRAHPETRLLIIGDGPERHTLERAIHALGIDGAAVLTGAVSNPFAIMRAADCFVLSSDYEGQPMVLLEAGALGLPVLSTDFGSVRDALPDEDITVVRSTASALADGMELFLAGGIPSAGFDVDRYNLVAIREAEEAILGSASVKSSSDSSSTMAPSSEKTTTAPQTSATITTSPATPMAMTHHMPTSED